VSSNYDDDSQRPKRLIHDRQEELEAVLDVFTGNAANVTLTPRMKREIATRIMNFWRVLSKYEGESVLSDEQLPDVSPIRERLGKETRVVDNKEGRKRGETYDAAPAVDELDYWYLHDVAHELERVAKKLGFMPDATDRPETSQFDESDLVTLVSARGQEAALEDAPDDITERVIDTLEEHRNVN